MGEVTLKIGKGLVGLPLETVTQTIGILARKRAGKSYLARRLAEQLVENGQQIVIVDPKGDWWGIRSAANGRDPGLPVVILGGERGDVKLERGGGEIVARLIVEEGVSVLLDLSLLRKHEVATFMAIFLETLYRLKALEKNRTPCMLLVDEADSIAPQKPQHGQERMLGAIDDVVRRGGQRGLGCTLITQRSAVLNKDVLTQVQILIALRTIAPQDLKALDAWIDVHGTPEERRELMASLPSLPLGDSWVWSPGWPTDKGIFKRTHTLPIETFDSGATPKPGEKRREPKKLAAIDIAVVSRQMADTIERSKADDPKVLRARIAELEKRLTVSRPVVERVEVPIYSKKELQLLEQLLEIQRKLTEKVTASMGVTQNLLEVARSKTPEAPTPVRPKFRPPVDMLLSKQNRAQTNGSTEQAGGALRRMLIALAQRPQGLTNRQLGVRAGISSKSGTFSTYLSRARTEGWISKGQPIQITKEGLNHIGDFLPLPEGAELREYWKRELGGKMAIMLDVLAEAHPEGLSNAELGEQAGISSASGTFSTYLSRMRTLELITRGQPVRMSEELV